MRLQRQPLVHFIPFIYTCILISHICVIATDVSRPELESAENHRQRNTMKSEMQALQRKLDVFDAARQATAHMDADALCDTVVAQVPLSPSLYCGLLLPKSGSSSASSLFSGSACTGC
jgi:hypothetical protein